MDENRWPHDVADDPVHDLHRMLGRAELEDPGLRAVRTGQEDPVAVQPDDEDLRLDRAVHVPARGFSTHPLIVFMPAPAGGFRRLGA